MLKGREAGAGRPALSFVATKAFIVGFNWAGDVFCWAWAAAFNARSDIAINQQRSIYKAPIFVIMVVFLSSPKLNFSKLIRRTKSCVSNL
jgi:hypothetical protein